MVKDQTLLLMMVVTLQWWFYKVLNGKQNTKQTRAYQTQALIKLNKNKLYTLFLPSVFHKTQNFLEVLLPNVKESVKKQLPEFIDFMNLLKIKISHSQPSMLTMLLLNLNLITFMDADILFQMVFSEPLMLCLLVKKY